MHRSTYSSTLLCDQCTSHAGTLSRARAHAQNHWRENCRAPRTHDTTPRIRGAGPWIILSMTGQLAPSVWWAVASDPRAQTQSGSTNWSERSRVIVVRYWEWASNSLVDYGRSAITWACSTSAMAKDGKELILRLQYPEEVGAVGECELEGILSRLQQVRVLKR